MIAHYFLFSFFKLRESAWYQRRVQALDAPQWQGWENLLLAIYHTEEIRARMVATSTERLLTGVSRTISHALPPDQVSVGTLEEIFSNSGRVAVSKLRTSAELRMPRWVERGHERDASATGVGWAERCRNTCSKRDSKAEVTRNAESSSRPALNEPVVCRSQGIM